MIKSSSRLFVASLVSAAALHAGCTSPETLGGSTQALETAYTIDFNDLLSGEVVAPSRYSAQGVALDSAGGAGLHTGYPYNGSMTLAVNTVAGNPDHVLVIRFHDPANAQAFTTATQVSFDLADTESSMTVRSYGDTTGGQLLSTSVINQPSAHITLAGPVGRIEVEDDFGDGFVVDNLGYLLHTEGAETCASRLEERCPSDATWKNHGQYVSCVSHASQTCVDDGLATAQERAAYVQAAAHSSVGK